MTGSILTMVYLLLLLPIYLLHKVLDCDQQDQVDRGKEGREVKEGNTEEGDVLSGNMFSSLSTKNSNIEI